MEFSRVYRGKVTAINHIYTSPFGMRSYVLSFGTKRLYFECHIKQTLPVSVGATIRFTAHQSGKCWMIDEVLDSIHIDKLEVAEQERRVKILMEEAYEQQYI